MKVKLSLFVCLLFAIGALSATNRTAGLASLGKAGNGITGIRPATSAQDDIVVMAAGISIKAGLVVPTGVGGLSVHATVSSNSVCPDHTRIGMARQTIPKSSSFAEGKTPHRVTTVNGTWNGCAALNDTKLLNFNLKI